jgi:hypothetical protein
MGDEKYTGGDSAGRADVVSEFDQTNGLADGLDGDDGGELKPAERDSVFEEAMRSIDDSLPENDENSATSYSEEGKP